MFKSINECYARYELMLKEYLTWLKGRRVFYSEVYGPDVELENVLSCVDSEKKRDWERGIKYAQIVLGITPEEHKIILDKIKYK